MKYERGPRGFVIFPTESAAKAALPALMGIAFEDREEEKVVESTMSIAPTYGFYEATEPTAPVMTASMIEAEDASFKEFSRNFLEREPTAKK